MKQNKEKQNKANSYIWKAIVFKLFVTEKGEKKKKHK